MSGILGVCQLDSAPVDPELFRGMWAGAHVDANGGACRVDGPVGLFDLRREPAQGVLDGAESLVVEDSSGVMLTFDGRLDNLEELGTMLTAERCHMPTLTDADLVLRAYKVWGAAAVTRLLGDFAFAIWDAGRQELFCARDRLGIKPFYYVLNDKRFVFASEVRHLLRLPDLVPQPNEQMMARYLINSYENVEETLYRGVYRLPPAGWLSVSPRAVRKGTYWQLSRPELLRYRSDGEYAEHFRSLFHEAVRCRMRARGTIGVCLSGGFDSSAVACMAAAIRRKTPGVAEPLEVFSVAFDDPAADERRYVEAVQLESGLAGHLLFPERDRVGLDIEQAAPHPLGPLYYPNLFMMQGILKRARERGVRVLLSGAGGDDLFCGFEYCADLLRHRQWRALYAESGAIAGLTERARSRVLYDWALRPLLPRSWRRRARMVVPRRVPNWIRPEFVRRHGLDEWKQVAASRDRDDSFPDLARRFAKYRLFGSGCYAFGFEEEDRFFRPASLEYRSPFFDVRLLEFTFMLPQAQKYWRGQTKVVARNSVNGILPEAIRTRSTKADFGPFMDRELRVRQRRHVEHLLLKSTLASAGVIDDSKVSALWQQYVVSGGPRRWDVLTLLNLERWFRYTVHGRSVGHEAGEEAH
jgi:asparagine synthase (glutamine-hydrolysing)